MNKLFLSMLCALAAHATLTADSCKKATLVDVDAPSLVKSPKNCLIHAECAESIANIQKELAQFNLGLKIFEAYNAQPENDVASELPMRHARGTAIDVTLVNLKTGEELPMPTAYDDFSGNCTRSGQKQLTQEVFNAILLEDIMSKHGWVASPEAWWHFDFNGWHDYPEVCN